MSFLLDNKKIELNNMDIDNNIVCNIEMELSKLTKETLLAKCEENGIKKCKSKKKGELIALLENKQVKKQSNLINEYDDEFEFKSVNNICENNVQVDTNFKKCVEGYHLINSSFINETTWEEINATILSSSGFDIYFKSNGSHSSGMDIDCSLGRFSNKSAKYSYNPYNKKSIDVSSYRLTGVCSGQKCGTPTEIINEIAKRKNFEFYSIIVRDETCKDTISYDWLLIPSNYLILDPSSYTWEPTIGKRGKNKDTQVGWNTNEINGCKMTITFSMSSQLWIHIEMTEEIKKFIVASAVVENKPKYTYIELLDKLTNI